MEEKKIAAFFDIDGTIYREGLITELFKKFITHEIISESKWFDDVRPAYMKWDRRQGEYDDYLLYFDRIDAQCIARDLVNASNDDNLDLTGLKAKIFVLKNKSVDVQAKRVVDFLETLVK